MDCVECNENGVGNDLIADHIVTWALSAWNCNNGKYGQMDSCALCCFEIFSLFFYFSFLILFILISLRCIAVATNSFICVIVSIDVAYGEWFDNARNKIIGNNEQSIRAIATATAIAIVIFRPALGHSDNGGGDDDDGGETKKSIWTFGRWTRTIEFQFSAPNGRHHLRHTSPSSLKVQSWN